MLVSAGSSPVTPIMACSSVVERERKMDHVCGPNSNLSFHAKDVVGGSSPSLTLYGDVVQREHSSSVKKNVMLSGIISKLLSITIPSCG